MVIADIIVTYVVRIDIKEKQAKHWLVEPAQTEGNSCASGHCKHNGTTCYTHRHLRTTDSA